MRTRFLVFFILLVMVAVLQERSVSARIFQGQKGDKTFWLETTLIKEVEYVRAVDVISYFQGEWEYDSLSGTLTFEPPNGERIGIKINYSRFLVGNKVFQHTTAPPIRREQHIYIPFYFAMTYLFPQIELREVEEKGTPTQEPSQTTPTLVPTPPRYIFQQPTKLEATPTQKPMVFDRPTPTPTLSGFIAPTPTPVEPIEQQIVILDPGNDPANPGAGVIQELREYELTLRICEKLAEYLRNSQNFEVLLTRGRDASQPVTNTQRIALANKNQGDLFVSVQCGSLYTSEVSLGSVFFMNPELDHPEASETSSSSEEVQSWLDSYKKYVSESHQLSQMIHKELRECYRVQNIISMESNPRPGRFAILRGLTMPGVVVELGNLAHPMTASYLASERIQDDIVFHLGKAITDYLYGESAGE